MQVILMRLLKNLATKEMGVVSRLATLEAVPTRIILYPGNVEGVPVLVQSTEQEIDSNHLVVRLEPVETADPVLWKRILELHERTRFAYKPVNLDLPSSPSEADARGPAGDAGS